MLNPGAGTKENWAKQLRLRNCSATLWFDPLALFGDEQKLEMKDFYERRKDMLKTAIDDLCFCKGTTKCLLDVQCRSCCATFPRRNTWDERGGSNNFWECLGSHNCITRPVVNHPPARRVRRSQMIQKPSESISSPSCLSLMDVYDSSDPEPAICEPYVIGKVESPTATSNNYENGLTHLLDFDTTPIRTRSRSTLASS